MARSADHRSAVAANVLPELVWQSRSILARHLVYLVCQICGCDIVSGMPNRGLKGAKAPSQVSKVSRQAITLGNLQSTDKTYEVCKCALSKLRGCDIKEKKKKPGQSQGAVR